MQSSTRKVTLAITLVIISIAIMECSGNPNPEQHETGEVASAIRYLQDLERIARPRQYTEHDDDSPYNHALILEMYLNTLDRKHARTPRFGKRGNPNGYSNKEYADFNVLKFLLQNSELLPPRESDS